MSHLYPVTHIPPHGLCWKGGQAAASPTAILQKPRGPEQGFGVPFPSHARQLPAAGRTHPANTATGNHCTVLGAGRTQNPSNVLTVMDRRTPARSLSCWPCPPNCSQTPTESHRKKNNSSVVSACLQPSPPLCATNVSGRSSANF